MNKNRVRRYTGLLLHYLREFRGHFGKPAGVAGFAFSIIICLFWGSGLVSFLERTGWLNNAAGVESFLGLILTVVNAFLVLFTLMYTLIFYPRSQRQEMLNVFTWPAEKECFAMLKLLDGNVQLILAATLTLPGMVASYAGCRSLTDGLRITACFGLLFSHALASYIIAALFMSLAGAVYISIPSRKPRFPLFLLLWLVTGFWLIAFAYAPPWGCEQYIRMISTAWMNFWTGLICSGAKGQAGVILATGAGLLILLRLALTIIGICYVENIQKLDDAITAAQKSITAQFGKPVLRYLPLISRQVQSLWFKDLKIVTQQHTMIVSVFISILLVAFFVTRDNINGSSNSIILLNPDLISLVAVLGTSIFQTFSSPIFGIEGSEAESLVPYPVRARQVLLGKTLCAVSLHLPLFLFCLASVTYSGFSGDRAGLLLLWVCWLFPLCLTQISLGGWLKVVPGIHGEGRSSVANLLGILITIGFIALYYLVFIFAKSVHWLFYPAGCLGYFGLYYVIAGQVVRVLPGLSVWGDKARQERTETFASGLVTDIIKIGLATIPVFLVYIYISAGYRPMRYFPANLRDVFYIVPVLVALALFQIRVNRWIRCILAGSLLFVMAGTVLLHQADLGNPFLIHFFSYPEKIYNYLSDSSDTDEDREIRLPEQVAKQFGYDPAMTMDEIYQTPSPPSERLGEFLTALKRTGIFYEIYYYDGLKEWIADSASNMPVSEKLDIWLNAMPDKSNRLYVRFVRDIFFHNWEDWTSDDMYLFVDKVFRNLNTGHFQKIADIDLNVLPFESMNVTDIRKLVQIFRDKVSKNSSFAIKFDAALQSYAQNFEINNSCLQILSLLPGHDAFDAMQELLHKNQTSSGIRMPSFGQLTTGDTKPGIKRLKMLWQEYPEYAAFLSVKHPMLSGDILAINAMHRFTETSEDIREWIEKTIRIRNRDGEIVRYIDLSGGAPAFHGKALEAETLLCMAIPKYSGLLASLKLDIHELIAVCQCMWEPLYLEDARFLMTVVKNSPRNFAKEIISWNRLLINVEPHEYADLGVTLLSNGAFFDIIFRFGISYKSSKDNHEYELIESLNKQLSGPRWHGSLRLHKQFAIRIYLPYVLLLKHKGRNSALSFLRTIGQPFQKDIRVLTDVLTHGEDIDIGSIYDYCLKSDRYPSLFLQEALIRALLEKGETSEVRFLLKKFERKQLAHVWNFSEKPGKKTSGGFFLTALGYTLLFVMISAALRLIPRLRKKNFDA